MSLRALTAVYCYFFPEVRPLLRDVERALPDEAYLLHTPARVVEEALAPIFGSDLHLPATSRGEIDLDRVHEPVLDGILAAYAQAVPDLAAIRYRYPTSGSSEGLFHLLARCRTRGDREIHVLRGEYEGYAIQARNLGLDVREHRPEDPIEPGPWFLSDPSARDGNLLPDGFVRRIAEAGGRIVLDLSYAGSTRPHVYDMGHPNIEAVTLSFSKPYGVFRSRIGGFTFSREEVPSLIGNKWFKDTLRLFQALRIAQVIGPHGLEAAYRPVQESVLAEIHDRHGLSIRPSDAVLLGHLPEGAAATLPREQIALLRPYARGDGYRFCLTPYFEEREAGGGRPDFRLSAPDSRG